ncbi:hypothetical protein I317_01979 [Kwoniella heveanensis CBS 569]|nr:hypothetical protein I317_01979 [Kwoniella heveanensis CBS 569]
MSFRTSFLPSLLHARPPPTATGSSLFQQPFRRAFRPPSAFRQRLAANQPRVISIARSAPPPPRRISPLMLGIGAAIGLTSFSLANPSRQVRCDGNSLFSSSSGNNNPLGKEPAPESILSVYELSFGAVCGICSGVFIKKGARAIAFLLGGVFILLQYLSSRSFITVDWAKLGSRYDSAFGAKTSAGGYKGPTVGGVWNRIVDFLTSNFQRESILLIFCDFSSDPIPS